MTTSPERCLGGLIKDINEDINPLDLELDSKDGTDFSSSNKIFLPLDSTYPSNSFLSHFSLDSEYNKFNLLKMLPLKTLNKSIILSALNSQRNSIILQKSLMEMSKENIDGIIKEMIGAFNEIIKNKNGNYFCSDLFKVCDKNQRIIILNDICNSISEICVDEYGTHPIQTLIELSQSEEEYKLILSSFNDNNKILNVSMNQNGSFVIQKIIIYIPERYRMDFNLLFIKCLKNLSMNIYGVSPVKKFINYMKNELLIKKVINIILSNFIIISQNQSGNYLIQFILEYWWNTNEGTLLKKLLMKKFHILALNNFSSYICIFFLKLSSYEDKEKLMSSLIKSKNITILKQNEYGNIIVNKLTNSLKHQKKEDNNNKNQIPLSLNNIQKFSVKSMKEKDETKNQ